MVATAQRVIDVAVAVQDEAIVAVCAIEPEVLDDGTWVESHRAPGHVALDGPAIVSGALNVSAVHAEHRVRTAVRLAADGPAGSETQSGLGGLHEAMRRGELDAYRASVVADELELAPPPVAAAVVAALGGHLCTDTAAQLRRRCRTVLSRVSPDLLLQRTKQARERCALRRWAEEPGVDKWEGTFPSEDAARAWAAIDARAQQLVTDGSIQRIDRARAQALIDLVTGSATITTTLVLTTAAHPTADQGDRAATTGDRTEVRAAPARPGGRWRPRCRDLPAPRTWSRSRRAPRGERVLVTRGFLDAVATALDTTTVERTCHPITGALLDPATSGAYRCRLPWRGSCASATAGAASPAARSAPASATSTTSGPGPTGPPPPPT